MDDSHAEGALVIHVSLQSNSLWEDYQQIASVLAASAGNHRPAPVIGRPLHVHSNMPRLSICMILDSLERNLEKSMRAAVSSACVLSWMVWHQSITGLSSIQRFPEPEDTKTYSDVHLFFFLKEELTEYKRQIFERALKYKLLDPYTTCGSSASGPRWVDHTIWGWSKESQIVNGEEVYLFLHGVQWLSKETAFEYKERDDLGLLGRLEEREGDSFYEPLWRFAGYRYELLELKWEQVGPAAIRVPRPKERVGIWSRILRQLRY